jgi:TRAP-type C4-dicarboxylate transport system permease small subunit
MEAPVARRVIALHTAYFEAVKALAAGTIGLIFIVTVFQVFYRYFLNALIIWAEEFSRALLIWMCFLFAGAAFQRGEMVAVDMFTRSLKPLIRALVLVPAYLATTVFLGILIYQGWRHAVQNLIRCEVTFTYVGLEGKKYGYQEGQTSEIGIRIGLPPSSKDGGSGGVQGAWNGNVKSLGNGGFAGGLTQVTNATNAGYVGTGSDTGHTGGSASFGLNDDGTVNLGKITDTRPACIAPRNSSIIGQRNVTGSGLDGNAAQTTQSASQPGACSKALICLENRSCGTG